MRVTTRHEASRLSFTLEPGVEGEQATRSVMSQHAVTFDGVPEGDLHPDVVALAALLAGWPWLAGRLEMDRPVSTAFAEAVERGARVTVTPVDEGVQPRTAPEGGPVGLAYSGGLDSTAALEVLGPGTRPYFLERERFDGEDLPGRYDKSAPLHALKELSSMGVQGRAVRSDVELVREPMGLPNYLASGLPALLWAEHDGLAGISWGATLELTTRIASGRYRPYETGPFVSQMGAAWEAVGLPVANALAGVTQVGAAVISAVSPYGHLAQSCLRGGVAAPCGRCWKCVFAMLLRVAVEDDWPSGPTLDELLRLSTVAAVLERHPVQQELSMAWVVDRYKASPTADHRSEVLKALRPMLPTVDPLMPTNVFTPAYDAMHPDQRGRVLRTLGWYLRAMDEAQQEEVTGWSTRDAGTGEDAVRARAALRAALHPDEAAAMESPTPVAPSGGGGPTTAAAPSKTPDTAPAGSTRLAVPVQGAQNSPRPGEGWHERLKVPVIEHERLERLDLSDPRRAVHSVGTDAGFPLDFYAELAPSDVLTVSLHGAISRARRGTPNFWRVTSLRRRVPALLSIADPTLRVLDDEEIGIGWYVGNREWDPQDDVERLLRTAMDHVGARRLLLIGGSAGGFAALRLAARFPGSLALVTDPQTSIERYYPGARDRLFTAGWPGRDRREVIAEEPHRFDVCALYRDTTPDVHVHYRQSLGDHGHVKRHAEPFREAVAGTPGLRDGRYTVVLEEGELQGHGAITPAEFDRHLTLALDRWAPDWDAWNRPE